VGQGPEPGGWEAGWACRGNPGGGVHTAVGAEEGTCCTRTAWKAGFAENHRNIGAGQHAAADYTPVAAE